MSTFLVTPAHSRVPATRVTAVDLFELGEQVARHLARHKAIRTGRFDAEIGDDHGSIWQPGLPRPINFHISKEN